MFVYVPAFGPFRAHHARFEIEFAQALSNSDLKTRGDLVMRIAMKRLISSFVNDLRSLRHELIVAGVWMKSKTLSYVYHWTNINENIKLYY